VPWVGVWEASAHNGVVGGLDVKFSACQLHMLRLVFSYTYTLLEGLDGFYRSSFIGEQLSFSL
jgi:hypothetical protein